jgi:hypothetical protein
VKRGKALFIPQIHVGARSEELSHHFHLPVGNGLKEGRTPVSIEGIYVRPGSQQLTYGGRVLP